jgi:hypothetical protein
MKDVSNPFHDFSFRVCTFASSSKSCAPAANISSPDRRSSDWFTPASNDLLVDLVLWRLVIGRTGSLVVSGGCGVSRDLTQVYNKVPIRIVSTEPAR